MKKALLAIHLLLLVFWIGTGYLRSDAMFLVGLGVMGFSLVLRAPAPGGWRFGLWALLFVGLSLSVPARSFHFMALVFSALFVVEQYWGKVNEAPVFSALLLTAGAKTLSVVLGFPLRLQLSENVAKVLRMLGQKAEASGNLIHFEGRDFLVDSACAGLMMVEVSFLFCFFLLGLLEQRSGRRLSFWAVLGMILATGALILIYNQLRILFLVVFNIPPEHPMHEVLGLLGLGLYVFAPLWFLGGWFSGMLVEGDGTRIWRIGRIFSDWFLGIRAERDGTRIGRIWRIFTDWFLGIRAEMDGTRITRIGRIFADLFSGVSGADGVFRKGVQVVLIGFLGFFALVSVQKEPMRHAALESLVPVGLPEHCSRETLKDGVVKYRSDGLLIYVKPIQGWYDTEHTPLICWQGSGYEFGQIREQIIGKTTLYTGILEQKGVTPLYTAWWFDNGQEQTISQARWRWLDAGGATGFSLLNVTADTPGQLQQQLTRMIHD